MGVSQSRRNRAITEGADRPLCNLEWLRLRACRRLQPFDTTLSHCPSFDIDELSMTHMNQYHGCQNNMPQREKNRKTM